jgi:anti-sigma factor RsiW
MTTEASSPSADEDEILGTLSDYLDGLLPEAERAQVAAKIAADPAWRQTHDELTETRNALSGLQKARAPSTFAQDVTETIHKRSAGRFFARRTLGDRVPFGVLLVVALLALGVIGAILWSSETGSLKVHGPAAPGAPTGTEQMPRP